MNGEQRQELLSSDRMIKTEDLTQGNVYRIHYLSPSYADDDDTNVIVQLDICEGA